MASEKEKLWLAILVFGAASGGGASFGSWQHSSHAGLFAGLLLLLLAQGVWWLFLLQDQISRPLQLLAAELGKDKEDDYYNERRRRPPATVAIAQELVRIRLHLERLTKAAEQTSSVNGMTPPSVCPPSA